MCSLLSAKLLMIKGQNILQGNKTVSVGVLGVLSIVSGAQVCLTQSRIGAATCSCGSGLKASSMQSIKWTPHWRLLLLDLLLNYRWVMDT